jgi:transposase
VPEVRFALSYQLRDRPLKDPDNQKLLRFLEEPLVEPTNNRVERMLRPAVIARKVSQCSKTWAGAHAFAAFASVIQTRLKKGAPSSVLEALVDLFRTPLNQAAPA